MDIDRRGYGHFPPGHSPRHFPDTGVRRDTTRSANVVFTLANQ